MYFLDIKCVAMLVACIINPDPQPYVPRYYETHQHCDRALMQIAKDWKPASGAWVMNCVRWPDGKRVNY